MCQPPGFVKQGKDNLVCRLRKALDGLKLLQGAREWNDTIDELILSLGLQKCIADGNLYIDVSAEGILLLLHYVDALLLTGDNYQRMDFVQELMRRYEITDLGEMHTYLQVEFFRTEDGIHMNQHNFTTKLLKQFGMHDSRLTSTPMHESLRLSTDMGEKQLTRPPADRSRGKFFTSQTQGQTSPMPLAASPGTCKIPNYLI